MSPVTKHRVSCIRPGDPEELACLVGDYEDEDAALEAADAFVRNPGRRTWMVRVTPGVEHEQEVHEFPEDHELNAMNGLLKSAARWEQTGDHRIVKPPPTDTHADAEATAEEFEPAELEAGEV